MLRTEKGDEVGLACVRVEVAAVRWAIAQELGCWTYAEQDEDARLLDAHFGGLPE